ncbi:MAG: hypothetical protein RIR53_469 [Bacteroidota bacterium]|jgi:hypothetical protein
MAIENLPERLLQRAAHRALAVGGRRWTCTNGQVVQIISPGTVNVHEGPDYLHLAVLADGIVTVGAGEFHVRSSAWEQHHHSHDRRYSDVILHVVLQDDAPVERIPWTLVVPYMDVVRSLRRTEPPVVGTGQSIEEVQRAALLRLQRNMQRAVELIDRLGIDEALVAMMSEWLDRIRRKRTHPIGDEQMRLLRQLLPSSPMGQLIRTSADLTGAALFDAVTTSERVRIASEGAALRREVLVNVVLPMCCALGSNEQFVVLLQWYWSTPALHRYGSLGRRYPEHDQDYVWQQQGLLEYSRLYAPLKQSP